LVRSRVVRKRRRPLEKTRKMMMMMASSPSSNDLNPSGQEEEEKQPDSRSRSHPGPPGSRSSASEGDIGIDNSGIVGDSHSHLPYEGSGPRNRNSPALVFLEHAKRVWKFTDNDSKMTQGEEKDRIVVVG